MGALRHGTSSPQRRLPSSSCEPHVLTYSQTNDIDSHPPRGSYHPFFKDTPELEYLAISRVELELTPPFLASWKALTTLRLEYCFVTAADLITLLSHTAETLATLALRRIELPDTYLDAAVPIPSVDESALLAHRKELDVDFF